MVQIRSKCPPFAKMAATKKHKQELKIKEEFYAKESCRNYGQ
jgi:hypothetical protein